MSSVESQDNSPFASTTSGISLGQQIQQKSRQDFTYNHCGDVENNKNMYRKSNNNNQIAGCGNEDRFNFLGDAMMCGSISNVLEKDSNLSRRVHQLLESDESFIGGDLVNTSRVNRPESYTDSPPKQTMAYNTDNSQFLSFHELLPNKTSANITTVNSALLNAEEIDASRCFTALHPDKPTPAKNMEHNGRKSPLLKLNLPPNDTSTVNASSIFKKLEPYEISGKTPFKSKTKIHINENSYSKPPFTSLGYQCKQDDYCVEKKSFEIDNMTLPSVDNTEYGDLPNFIDLSSNVISNFGSVNSLPDEVRKQCTGLVVDDSKLNNNHFSLRRNNDSPNKTFKDVDALTEKILAEHSSFNYKYSNPSPMVSQSLGREEKTSLENATEKLIEEVGKISKVIDSGPVFTHLTNSHVSPKFNDNRDDFNNKFNNSIPNRSTVEDSTMVRLNHSQSDQAALNLSHALTNDSLALQVKNLLEVESDESFENQKLLKEQVEPETNKSLNLSTMLHDFENTELWGYVQKFIPSNKNENLYENRESFSNKNSTVHSNYFNSTRENLPSDSLASSPNRSSAAKKLDFNSFNNQVNSIQTKCAEKGCADRSVPEVTNSSKKEQLPSAEEKSKVVDSFSKDFEGYVQKTCQTYLNEQKQTYRQIQNNQSYKKDEDSSFLFGMDSLTKGKLSFDQKHNVSSGGTHFLKDENEPSKTMKSTKRQMSAEAKRIFEKVASVEDSIRKSLNRTSQIQEDLSPQRSTNSGRKMFENISKSSKLKQNNEFRLPQGGNRSWNDNVDIIKDAAAKLKKTESSATYFVETKYRNDGAKASPTLVRISSPQADIKHERKRVKAQKEEKKHNISNPKSIIGEHMSPEIVQESVYYSHGIGDSNANTKPITVHDWSFSKVKKSETDKRYREVTISSPAVEIHKRVPHKVASNTELPDAKKTEEKVRSTSSKLQSLPTYEELLQRLNIDEDPNESSKNKERERTLKDVKISNISLENGCSKTILQTSFPQSATDGVPLLKVEEKNSHNVETQTLKADNQSFTLKQLFLATSVFEADKNKTTEAVVDAVDQKKTPKKIVARPLFEKSRLKISETAEASKKAVSMACSGTSMRSMVAQCDEQSVKTLTPFRNNNAKNDCLLPWLPDSLHGFKSLDDNSQAGIVKELLALFTRSDCEQKQPLYSRQNNNHQNDLDSFFATKYAGAYHGENAMKQTKNALSTHQAVQRLLNKIERQRKHEVSVVDSLRGKPDAYEIADDSLQNSLLKSDKCGEMRIPKNEKAYYVKITSDDFHALISAKSSVEKQQQQQQKEVVRNKVIKAAAHNTEHEKEPQSKKFHTSSPIKHKSLAKMLRERPDVVLQSLQSLLDHGPH